MGRKSEHDFFGLRDGINGCAAIKEISIAMQVPPFCEELVDESHPVFAFSLAIIGIRKALVGLDYYLSGCDCCRT